MDVLTGSLLSGARAYSTNRRRAAVPGRVIPSVVLSIAAGLVLMGALAARADDPPVHSEYAVKAAFLLNFAKFVEWPAESMADPNAPIMIGVLGTDPFGSILDDTVKGQKIKNREIQIKRADDAASLAGCHVVFVGSSEENRLKEVCQALNGSSALTVGDMKDFAERGGAISLVNEKGKIRFDVNTEAAKTAKLKLGSQLLNLARTLIGKTEAGGHRS